VSSETQRIAYVLFTPVFFVNIGLSVNFDGLSESLGVAIAIIIAAIAGKLVGCFVGARVSKFSTRESLQVGIGMIPRAEVALIVTNLGLKMNIIGHEIFTSIILLVLVSTIVTPIMLKASFKGEKKLKESA
jgi:Kef-type K+ transport system membrane component KefB